MLGDVPLHSLQSIPFDRSRLSCRHMHVYRITQTEGRQRYDLSCCGRLLIPRSCDYKFNRSVSHHLSAATMLCRQQPRAGTMHMWTRLCTHVPGIYRCYNTYLLVDAPDVYNNFERCRSQVEALQRELSLIKSGRLTQREAFETQVCRGEYLLPCIQPAADQLQSPLDLVSGMQLLQKSTTTACGPPPLISLSGLLPLYP